MTARYHRSIKSSAINLKIIRNQPFWSCSLHANREQHQVTGGGQVSWLCFAGGSFVSWLTWFTLLSCQIYSVASTVKNIYSLQRHIVSFLSPSSKENNVQLLLHVWSTDTHRTQQAGTGLMHCLQSHLSSPHCSLMTKNAGSIFSGSKFVLRRPRYLCRPAAEGSGCCLCLSSGIEAREQRQRRGPKKEGKIYFVFRCFNPLV